MALFYKLLFMKDKLLPHCTFKLLLPPVANDTVLLLCYYCVPQAIFWVQETLSHLRQGTELQQSRWLFPFLTTCFTQQPFTVRNNLEEL